MRHGTQRVSAGIKAEGHVPLRPRPGPAPRSTLRILVVAVLAALVGAGAVAGAAPSRVEAQAGKPKAVIIVGPTHSSTTEYLAEGRLFASQATDAGMQVTTVFHPYATWDRVVQETRDANLVVYFGHGNGWPSPYAPFQERTKNGFGLNPIAGGSATSVAYYGGDRIRKSLRLAQDAVVILYRACYAAGNGQLGQPYPSPSIAVQRADNFAAAFLRPRVGGKAVFAFWTKQWVDFAAQLMRPDRTMEEILRTPSQKPGWYTSGWVGDDPVYANSTRTPGARLLLDRHSSRGFSRALTGDLGMTTDVWRTEAPDPDSSPTPSPTPTPTPMPTTTPTPEPTATPDPTAAPTADPTVTPTPEPASTPDPGATPTATPATAPTPTAAPAFKLGSPPPPRPRDS